MTTDMKWTEAPDVLRGQYRRKPKAYGLIYDQLSAGKTVWVEQEWANRAQGAIRAWVRNNHPDKKVRSHQQELHGEPGIIFWLDANT